MAAIEHEFVGVIDDALMCSICTEVARDPQQEGNCGKLFCRKCIEKLECNKCPNCRNKPKYFEDKKSYREIQDLKVKCTNMKNGCGWIGPLGGVIDHVTKSCDFTLVPCKYEDLGCTKKHTRKRMREHEDDANFHISMAMDTAKKFKQLVHTLYPNGITIKMTDYKRRKEMNECYYSAPFYTHPNGYKLRLTIWPNGLNEAKGNHMTTLVTLFHEPHNDSLPQPFQLTITVQLLNQISDRDHHSEETYMHSKIDDSLDPDDLKFISHESLEVIASSTLRRQYLKDDTLYFKIECKLKNHKPWLDTLD